jgi:hypothetical protein
MIDPILDYIREHVTEWPEGADTIRLDKDGEICFVGCRSIFNFFPVDKFTGQWTGSKYLGIGNEYAKEQWEQPAKPVPFGEMRRADQLRLVEHVLDGGFVEFKSLDSWYPMTINRVSFYDGTTYRAVKNA